MPYKNASDKTRYMQSYMNRYIALNPSRVEAYHRSQVLRRAELLGRFPSKRSIIRYQITEHELNVIAHNMSRA